MTWAAKWRVRGAPRLMAPFVAMTHSSSDVVKDSMSDSDSSSEVGLATWTTEKQHSGICCAIQSAALTRLSDSVWRSLCFLAAATPLLSTASCIEVGAVGKANEKPHSSSIVLTQPSVPPDVDTTSSATALWSLKRALKRVRPYLLITVAQILSLMAHAEGGRSRFQAAKKSTTRVSGSCSMRDSESGARSAMRGRKVRNV